MTSKSLRWAAPVALVAVTGLAACGGSRGSDQADARTATPVEAAAGYDVHLQNQADNLATRATANAVAGSDVHLQNQADNLATRATANAVAGSDVHLQNQADDIGASQGTGSDSSDEFLPGSRRVPR